MIPKNLKTWEKWFDKEGNVTHVVASNDIKTKWYLYQVSNGNAEKIKTGRSPRDLR